KIFIHDEGLTKEFAFFLDPTKSPRQINWVPAFGVEKGRVMPGIYRLDADNLILRTSSPRENSRPTQFKTEVGKSASLLVLQREKPARGDPRADAEPPASKRETQHLAEWLRGHDFGHRKWQVDLDEVHGKPEFKNTCTLCHVAKVQQVRAVDRANVPKRSDV